MRCSLPARARWGVGKHRPSPSSYPRFDAYQTRLPDDKRQASLAGGQGSRARPRRSVLTARNDCPYIPGRFFSGIL
jgi:hypothetical protein